MLDGRCVSNRSRVWVWEELLVREYGSDAHSDSDAYTHADSNANACTFAVGFVDAMCR